MVLNSLDIPKLIMKNENFRNNISLQIHTLTSTPSWKTDRILEEVGDTVEELSKEENWDFTPEEVITEDKNMRVVVDRNKVEASVDENGIWVSDPDSYRTYMKKVFDKPEQDFIRELVDENYPVPFHEVVEETGQFLGERLGSWSYEPNLVDGAISELHGLMALQHFYPEFLDPYQERVESNLDFLYEISSEDQVDEVVELIDNSDLESESLEEFYNDRPTYNISDYSRGDPPKEFAVRAVSILLSNSEYSVENTDYSDLEDWRQKKFLIDSLRDRAHLAAFRFLDERYAKEEGSKVFENVEYLESEILDINREICNEYNIPYEYGSKQI